MRLFEIVKPKFYLCTATKQTVGSIASIDGVICQLGGSIEGKLETSRPDGALSRERSLYLETEPLENAAYVYEVNPVDRVALHHTSWLKRLCAADPNQHGVIDQLVQGYWSGQEIPEARDEPWEHRCIKAKISKRVGGTARCSSPW